VDLALPQPGLKSPAKQAEFSFEQVYQIKLDHNEDTLELKRPQFKQRKEKWNKIRKSKVLAIASA
jgi:hypothetical protein